jgi:hypothetical protein
MKKLNTKKYYDRIDEDNQGIKKIVIPVNPVKNKGGDL